MSVDLGDTHMAATTTWVHGFRVDEGKLVERSSTYFHNEADGVLGALYLDGKGTICSAFKTRQASDVCSDLKTGRGHPGVPMTELRTWTRYPGPLPFESD